MPERKRKKQSKSPTKLAVQPAIKVERGDGVIFKVALAEEGQRELAREASFLEALAGTGIAPRLMERTESQLVLEDLGDGEEIKLGANFVTSSILLLNELKANGIRHGDLTSRNVIVRNNSPVAIDFSQATFVDEGGPYKRPKPDAYYFWQAVIGLLPDQRYVTRWQAVRKALGGDEDGAWDCLAGRSVTDLGCWDGDALAMAVAEGADGVGIDARADPLATAKDRWGRFGCRFLSADLMDDFSRYTKSEPTSMGRLAEDIVFMFNATWSWIVQRDERLARGFLNRIIEKSNVLFFETELYGDGPGAKFLRTQDDVGKLLAGKGREVERLATYAVGGRDAERIVWSVR